MCDDRHRSPPSRWPNSRPPSKPLPQNRRRHRPVTTRPPHKRRNEEEARDPKAGPPTTSFTFCAATLNGMSVLPSTADVVSPPRHARFVPLFGSAVMSDLSPECAPKRTSVDHSEFTGSRPNDCSFLSSFVVMSPFCPPPS